MKKYGMILAAVMTAFVVTACGNGSGIVINGTIAAQNEENQEDGGGESQASDSNESMVETAAPSSGTKIEIITGENQPPATQSMEAMTQPVTTAAPTTAAPTTAAPTTSAPRTTAAPETTAAKTYEVTDVSKYMYANSSVRVRSSYSTSSDILGALAVGEQVQITGESANGWMRVNWKGHEGFVSKSYLSDTAPQTGTATGTGGNTNTTPNPTQQNNTTPGPTGSNNTGSTGNSAVGPGGSTGNTGNTGSTPGTSTGGGSGSMSGSVVSLDPSGVTIRATDGNNYQFTWGSGNVPALEPGQQVQIQYSGNTITQISK